MPRRSILSGAERASLLSPPATEDEPICHYAFSETDLSLIRRRRGDPNRLGDAVQLCLLRFPGQGLLPDAAMPPSFVPVRPTQNSPGCKPGIPSTKPTGQRWRDWSVRSSGIRSPGIGATAPHHRRTA